MVAITFVYPDFESLGVESLMSVCAREGHKVELVHYSAKDSYFGERGKHIDYDELVGRIAGTEAQVAAFSCVTDNYQFQLSAARALKRTHPEIVVIMGGVHVTVVPEKVLDNAEVDAVAIGEADVSLAEFLAEGRGSDGGFLLPEKGVPGIVHKKDGRRLGDFVEGTLADLDSLPMPFKEPFYEAVEGARAQYYIMTSRGCPYRCAYCFNSYLRNLRKGCAVRRRSVENVIAELEVAKSSYGLEYVLFLDDCFTSNQRWLVDFCRAYERRIGIPFGCITSPLLFNEAKTRALASAGCINVQLGVQTLSEELSQTVLERNSNNEKIVKAITEAKRAGMMVQVDHMLGIPHDTLKLQEEATVFYNRYRPHVISVFWLTYFPKTTIVDTALSEGLISQEDIERIENGISLTDRSYLDGGSMVNPGPFYGISFLMNWLPLLPRFVVWLLIRSRLYRVFRIRNFFMATALPRAIQSIFNRRDYRGRSHIKRFLRRRRRLRGVSSREGAAPNSS